MNKRQVTILWVIAIALGAQDLVKNLVGGLAPIQAKQFAIGGEYENARSHGTGHINDTFRLTCDGPGGAVTAAYCCSLSSRA